MTLSSAHEILDYAIEQEQKAHDLYLQFAEQSKSEAMSAVFREFAAEEAGHRKKLEGVKAGNAPLPSTQKIMDLKIGDHLVDVKVTPEMSYQEALILAMKAEKNAYKLYHDLAQAADDPALKDLLLGLAQEEAKHKLRFEIEYDECVLREN